MQCVLVLRGLHENAALTDMCTKTNSVKGKLESWSAWRLGVMACFPLGLPKVAGSSPGAAHAKFRCS